MTELKKQLIGTWKSDKRRTLATFHTYHTLPLGKKRRLGSIFGKIEIRYTPSYAYVTHHEITERQRYEVIAEDADSIVIRVYSNWQKKLRGPMAGASVSQLHFVEIQGTLYYWISMGGFCEWFRKAPL